MRDDSCAAICWADFALAAVAQVLRDAGRPKSVIPNSRLDPRTQRLSADHPIHIGLGEGIGGQLPSPAARAAK